MKFGILLRANDSPQLTIDPENLKEFWFCHQYSTEIQPILSVNALPDDYVWLSNLSTETVEENKTLKHALSAKSIQSNSWLPKSLDVLAAEAGLRLPQQLNLLLEMVIKLLDFFRATYDIDLTLTASVSHQLAAKIAGSQRTSAEKELLPNLKNNIFKPTKHISIRFAPVSIAGMTMMTNLSANSIDLALKLKNIRLPIEGGWQRAKPKALEQHNGSFYAKVRFDCGTQQTEIGYGIKQILQQKQVGTSICWLNEIEFAYFNRHVTFDCLELFVNENRHSPKIQQILPFDELDRLSYTKCTATTTIVEALINSAEADSTINVFSYWVRTAVLTYYFELAEAMSHKGFCPSIINTQTGAIHFLHEQADFGQLVQNGFLLGIEPAGILFRE